MSVGNLKDVGNKGNNFPFQLAVLKLLDQISIAVGGGGGGGGTTRTPAMLRSSAPGTVTAGKKSVSIFNGGAVNGTVLGAILKPGEEVNWSVISNADTLGAIAYDGTGTDLLIITLI